VERFAISLGIVYGVVVYNSKWASTGGYGYYDQQNNRDFSAYVIQ
jgi:hypothetical protein